MRKQCDIYNKNLKFTLPLLNGHAEWEIVSKARCDPVSTMQYTMKIKMLRQLTQLIFLNRYKWIYLHHHPGIHIYQNTNIYINLFWCQSNTVLACSSQHNHILSTTLHQLLYLSPYVHTVLVDFLHMAIKLKLNVLYFINLTSTTSMIFY